MLLKVFGVRVHDVGSNSFPAAKETAEANINKFEVITSGPQIHRCRTYSYSHSMPERVYIYIYIYTHTLNHVLSNQKRVLGGTLYRT